LFGEHGVSRVGDRRIVAPETSSHRCDALIPQQRQAPEVRHNLLFRRSRDLAFQFSYQEVARAMAGQAEHQSRDCVKNHSRARGGNRDSSVDVESDGHGLTAVKSPGRAFSRFAATGQVQLGRIASRECTPVSV
jgi:hypothetical protein